MSRKIDVSDLEAKADEIRRGIAAMREEAERLESDVEYAVERWRAAASGQDADD